MTEKHDISRRKAIKTIGTAVGSVLISPMLWIAPDAALASSAPSSSARANAPRRRHDKNMTVVEPEEIDDSLANPGRGFATTGNTYNEDLENRRYPTSGVIQKRWYWDDIEPKEGKIDFSMIDQVLAKAAKNRQALNFRVMCQNIDMRIPKWAMQQGIKRPYYDDPVFLEKQANLIKALAERYDGNANLAFVDIGTVGQWGEWHTSTKHSKTQKTNIKMPTRENCEKIIDLYVKNFKKTPLLMLIGGQRKNVLHYAIENGSGWRADCWGDMDPVRWGLMKKGYPEMLSSADAYGAWKHGPVALETCWTMSKWYKEGWDIDYILSWALQRHASEVNNGDQPIPKKWWPKVQAFEKKLGYRFALKQLHYPAKAPAGGHMEYAMTWANRGVAPIYQRYPLLFHFRSVEDASKTWTAETDEDITKWMPGVSHAKSKLQLPHDMPAGTYELAVGIVNPGTDKPAIKLAIKGATPEGWYNMGRIQIS